MSSIWTHANPQLRDLAVYQPGKPIEETAREFGTRASDIIKLASNENPLGPSPKALAAMHAAVESTHLYPDGGGYYVTRALSEKLGVPADHIILGNGSNEVIEFMDGLTINAILRFSGGGWTLVDHAIGPTDVWYCGVEGPPDSLTGC